jgi:lysozyme family protein
MLDAPYLRIIDGLIGREGGYSNHPSDAGGETMWGVTAAVARRHGYAGPMAEMPREIAVEIYLQRYVIDPGFGRVHAVSPRIAEELVDTGVNMGQPVAAAWFQRWLTALNRQGRDYPDLKVDGVIGTKTIEALAAYLAKRGPRGEAVLLTALNCSQGHRYLELSEGRADNEDFLFGWLDARVELAP